MPLTFDQTLDFLARFHRPWLDDPSLDPADVPGFLPPPLATLHRRLGKLAALEVERPPFSAQDQLVPVSRLRDDRGHVIFVRENQGNWAVRCAVGKPDPSVSCDLGEDGAGGDRFRVVGRSLSRFLVTFCLREAVFSCPYLSVVDASVAADEVLARPARWLLRGGRYVSNRPGQDVLASDDEQTLVLDAGGSLWVGSRAGPVAPSLAPGLASRVMWP